MNNDIDFVNEIMSDKKKFIHNVCDVSFTFKKFVNNMNHNMELIEFIGYNAHNFEELEHFYDVYKSIECDKLEIKSVAKVNGERFEYSSDMFEYSVMLYKKYIDVDNLADYIVYAEMLFSTY